MIREMATRFGEYKLGLFWMLFEPLLGVIVIGLLIGGLVGRTVPEIPYPFFLLNGFLVLRLFTGPMNTGVNAIASNQGLLVYATVRPIDPLLARFIFELLITVYSAILFILIAMWIGVGISVDDLLTIVAAYLLAWLCGCGFGLIFGMLSVFVKETEKVVTVLQRPMLFISAVLYPTNSVPDSMRELLLINPLVHCIELSRHALFPNYHVQGANLMYPAAFAIVVLSIGLALFQNHRHRLSQA